jgi:hypothetical protein
MPGKCLPNEFDFDQKSHIYHLNGKIIPSVTRILADTGIYDYKGVPPEVMEAARLFGQACHRLTELYDLETLDMVTVNTPLIPYLTAWQKFRADFKVVIYPSWIEKPICSYKYQFGTIPDRICSIGNKVTLVEVKSTATIQPAVGIQLAGQEIAVEENYGKVRQRIAVQLKSDGTYSIKEFKNPSDKSIFISALNLWRWREENLKNG